MYWVHAHFDFAIYFHVVDVSVTDARFLLRSACEDPVLTELLI